MFKKENHSLVKILTALAIIGFSILLIYSLRHFMSSNLLPIIRYFDSLIRASLRDIKEHVTIWKLLCFWGISYLYGVIHAAGPGHGKSIMGAYFIGRKEKLSKAFLMAGIISLTHILSSVVLAFIFSAFLKNMSPFFKIRLQGYFIATSGAIILALGLFLLFKKISSRNEKTEDEASVIYRNPFILGISAGLVPCPVTILLMTFAISQNMTLIGLAAVSALSAGMFTLLCAVGLTAVKGREGIVLSSQNKGIGKITYVGEILELTSLALLIFVGSGMVAAALS